MRDITYTKLECVGRGGSSKVYKVMAPNRKIFALKRIRLQVRCTGQRQQHQQLVPGARGGERSSSTLACAALDHPPPTHTHNTHAFSAPLTQGRDAEAASGFLDEITLLQRLAGQPNIIQLVDSEVHRSEGLIYMVLECGDVDLARLLQVGCGGWGGQVCGQPANSVTAGAHRAPPSRHALRRPSRCRSTKRRGESAAARAWTRTSFACTGSRCCWWVGCNGGAGGASSP